jgi:SOS response regulatory protein OraA/RecX
MPDTYLGKAKQSRFLQYRSFTGAQIRQALGTDIDIDDA